MKKIMFIALTAAAIHANTAQASDYRTINLDPVISLPAGVMVSDGRHLAEPLIVNKEGEYLVKFTDGSSEQYRAKSKTVSSGEKMMVLYGDKGPLFKNQFTPAE